MREPDAMLYSWEDRACGETPLLQELAPIMSCCRQHVLINGKLVRENQGQTPCFQALAR